MLYCSGTLWSPVQSIRPSVGRYASELQEAPTRLVLTPLTLRCWLTISQALRVRMGAACMGPAGTGKSETTKDLAKALGQWVVVLNCSEQMDADTVRRLATGLAAQGSWLCLDEINRLDPAVLSVAFRPRSATSSTSSSIPKCAHHPAAPHLALGAPKRGGSAWLLHGSPPRVPSKPPGRCRTSRRGDFLAH